MKTKFTIMGGTGFIGRNFAEYLEANGHEVVIAPRDVKTLEGQDLGHLVYILGLTGENTRHHPHDAIEAHIGLLSWVLQNTKFESFLYCSSTRVYENISTDTIATETTPLVITPDEKTLFTLTKLMGESLCQRMQNPKIRIVRPSNVYGIGQSKATFLGAVLDEVKRTGEVTIMDSPNSVKDYIAIEDVCELLTKIILEGKEPLYNLASGVNVTTQQIGDWIVEAGYKVHFSGQNPKRLFPQIGTELIEKEFAFKPRSLGDDIGKLLGK